MTSLRRSLLVLIVPMLLGVLLLAGAAAYVLARRGLGEQLDASLVARARTFASLVVVESPDAETPDAQRGVFFEHVGSLDEEDLGVLLRVRTDDGRILAQSPDWPWRHTTPGPLRPGEAPVVTDTRTDDGEPARAVTLACLPLHDNDEDPPAPEDADRVVTVEVIGRTDSARRAAGAVLGALIVGGLVAAAGTGATVWVGVRRGLRPVGRLCAELDRIDAREPAKPSPAAGYPEELRPIVGAIETLLGRVGEAMRRERRFTDAAAHELRTPIAELRTVTDVASRWPDAERSARAIAEARGIADDMEALIECLLAVARGGAAYEGQPVERIALLPLARSLVAARAERMESARIACALEGDEGAAWSGPRGAVLAIVRNLVDNAAEHTPPGGSVRLVVAGAGGGARLEVENGPVSLTPADAERAFEPFWRADAARADRGRRGLGLAIVASMCDSLGLSRTAQVSEGRLVVRIGP